MKKRKKLIFSKKLIIFIFAFCWEIFLPVVAIGQPDAVVDLINRLAGFLKTLVISIGVIAVILGGYYLITGEGDPNKIEKGRQAILWALIGIGIVALALQLKNALCGEIGC